ncbi:hypothetical protein HZS_4349 [Henneguya salminicola]|nr:hypothetical protein HZS_4349 [Henneguya salminicola]
MKLILFFIVLPLIISKLLILFKDIEEKEHRKISHGCNSGNCYYFSKMKILQTFTKIDLLSPLMNFSDWANLMIFSRL